MEKDKGRKLSPGKRLGGFLLIIIGTIAGFVIGWGIINLIMKSPADNFRIPAEFYRIYPKSLISPVLGPVVLVSGIVIYFIILFTNSFTFDFSKPFWKTYKIKFFIINIIVLFLIITGIGFTLSIAATPMLIRQGLSWPISFVIPNMVVLILVLLLASFISIWAPLKRSIIKKRLLALGVSEEDISKGILVGISDPARSSFKKFSFIEDDVGMLWVEKDNIMYKGDTDSFRFSRGHLLAIERIADSGSLAALGGAVHVIIRFKQEDGKERRLRLHTEGNWTLKQVARALDRLAARLTDY